MILSISPMIILKCPKLESSWRSKMNDLSLALHLKGHEQNSECPNKEGKKGKKK